MTAENQLYRLSWLLRVLGRVEVSESGCWLWTGPLAVNGYGQTNYNGRSRVIHRQMWELIHGVKLDRWQYVCHKCDVKRCINPAHLWIGSPQQNSIDSAAKMRHKEARKDYCMRGHPLFGDNVRMAKQKGDGIRRVCKTCEKERMHTPEYKAWALEAQRRRRAAARASQ